MSLAFILAALRRRRRPEAVIDRRYTAWVRRDVPKPAEWRTRLQELSVKPLFSIVMPVHETNPEWLAEAVRSVRDQFYENWELLIADDGSQSEAVAACLARLPNDHRIDILRLSSSVGISAASNAALARARGDYVTFLDHDDTLAPHALAAVACEIAETPSLDLLFSDEDQLVRGRRASPYFKPGWNPDLLLSQNLVCHMAVYRRTLVTALGGLRRAYDGSQDYDLALRATAEISAGRIRHIPRVLYHWRQSPGSFSAVDGARCADAARRALADHLGPRVRIDVDASLPQWPLIRFTLPMPRPLVSIVGATAAVVSTGDYGLVEHVAEPGSARGDVLLFLAQGLQPRGEDWLEVLVAQAVRPEIGAAGARLTGPDGALLHAGFTLDKGRVAVSPAAPGDPDDPGYRGQFRLLRTVAAVSGDCLAIRRTVFEAAGGFTAAAGDYRDVDLCLRLAARGLRSVWAPQAWLEYLLPAPTRADGADWMRARWGDALWADPYRNPHLAQFGVK